MEPCIFCEIIAKKIPATIRYEDDEIIAFNDIHPKDRVHILLIPKKHIDMLEHTTSAEQSMLGHLVYKAKELAQENNCPSFRIMMANGTASGQEVFHMHLHMIGK